MTILLIGDSFTEPDTSLKIWPTVLGARIGNYPMVNRAIGGAGYVTHGNGSEPRRFSRQLLDKRFYNPAAIKLGIIFGSVNDWWEAENNNGFYRAMIWETHREFFRTCPSAKLLVITPQWAGPNPVTQTVRHMKDCVDQAMWGYDWQYGYLDPNAGGMWFPPNRLDLLKPDKFHPNQAGHNRIADMVEPHVRKLLGIV